MTNYVDPKKAKRAYIREQAVCGSCHRDVMGGADMETYMCNACCIVYHRSGGDYVVNVERSEAFQNMMKV